MATNITSMVDGIVMIQSGFGVPTHYSPFGSEYTDLETQIKYHNKTTKNNWVRFLDELDADIIISGSTFTGGTVSGDTIFLSGVTANTITANTYYGLPTTNNGGGQIYYMNLSETQNTNNTHTPIIGYNLLNTDFKTTDTNKNILVPSGSTQAFANFITKSEYPNSPIIPAGLWSFYLNITKQDSSDIEVYCKVYSVNDSNFEKELFKTEFKKITSIIGIPTSGNIRLDKYFNGCSINKEDRILVKIFISHNEGVNKLITLNSDGDKYSYLVSSLHLSIDSIVLDGGEY